MPAAKDSICPNGWHVPSLSEWKELIGSVGRNSANKLKDPNGWENESDELQIGLSGFNALPGGNWQFKGSPGGQSGSVYESMNYAAKFGTSEGASWSINKLSSEAIEREVGHSMYQGFSVRCIKDE